MDAHKVAELVAKSLEAEMTPQGLSEAIKKSLADLQKYENLITDAGILNSKIGNEMIDIRGAWNKLKGGKNQDIVQVIAYLKRLDELLYSCSNVMQSCQDLLEHVKKESN